MSSIQTFRGFHRSLIDRRRFLAGSAAVVAVGTLGTRTAYGSSLPCTITFGSSPLPATLSNTSVGLSIEKNLMQDLYSSAVAPRLTALAALGKQSNGSTALSVRIGGDSVENTTIAPATLNSYFSFAKANNLDTIYGICINDSAGYPDGYTDLANVSSNLQGATLTGIELGNEPDDGKPGSQGGDGFTKTSYWLTAFTAFSAQVNAYGWKRVGPASARPVTPYFGDAKGYVDIVTGHLYYDSTNDSSPYYLMDPTAEDGWSGDSGLELYQSTMYGAIYAYATNANSKPVRVGECAPTSGSTAQLHAAALRALDMIFQGNYAGASGFNFHIEGGGGYSAINVSNGDVYPLYYALQMAMQICSWTGGANQLPLTYSGIPDEWYTMSGSNPSSNNNLAVNMLMYSTSGAIQTNTGAQNVTAYAFKHIDGHHSLLVVNKTVQTWTFTIDGITWGSFDFTVLSPTDPGNMSTSGTVPYNSTLSAGGTFTVQPWCAVWFTFYVS